MQGDNFIQQVVYYEDHYLNFFNGLKPKVKKKFNWTLQLIATLENSREILQTYRRYNWSL